MTRLQEIIQKTSKCIERLQKDREKKVDPLVDDRTLKLRLYGIGNVYFSSIDQLENYGLQNEVSTDDFYVLDYMDTLAGRLKLWRPPCGNGWIKKNGRYLSGCLPKANHTDRCVRHTRRERCTTISSIFCE